MYADELSDVLRCAVQPLVKFRQFCDAKDATDKGLHKGELYHWNIYSDITTQGGTLVETSTMPESNFTITQGTLTMNEFGNSVPYSGKLDDLSRHPVEEVINKVLKNDARKAFDIQSYTQFDATPLRIVVAASGTSTSAVTLTTDGTATGTNSLAMGSAHVKTVSDLMKERNIPPYLNDDYFAISHPSTFRAFKNDLESVFQNVPEGFQIILNGEMGRYEGIRFIEQTFIPKGGAADSTTFAPATGTADPWDTNSAASSWAFFFGEDTVAEAMAIPEEIRGKIPTDFGRSRGIAWYYLGGFGIVHTNAVESRILKWDSAV